MMPKRLILLMGLFLLGACASAGTPSSTQSRDVITTEEIQNYSGDNVYLLVQSLHPAWLRTRGRMSMRLSAPVAVYVDGVRVGGVDELRSMDPRRVVRIQHLDARQATTRFGTGHANGAILVTMR